MREDLGVLGKYPDRGNGPQNCKMKKDVRVPTGENLTISPNPLVVDGNTRRMGRPTCVRKFSLQRGNVETGVL